MYDTADKHGSTKANKLGDKRFTAVDPVKGDVRNPQSMVQYTYVINNPLMYVDPLGEMPVIALNRVKELYITGKLDENGVAKTVLVLNMLTERNNTVINSVAELIETNSAWTIYAELEPELRDKNPTVQATNVAFHEIAQVLAAKDTYRADRGRHTTFPYLEEPNGNVGKGEMDIYWNSNVWEVKPYYSSGYNTSLKKYIPNYQAGKDTIWYQKQGATRWPGYQYSGTTTAKLFQIGDKKYDIHVQSVGRGKIGYFITMDGCQTQNVKQPAQVFAAEMKAVKENLNQAALSSAMAVILLSNDFIPVAGQLDNVVAAERSKTALNRVVAVFKSATTMFAY